MNKSTKISYTFEEFLIICTKSEGLPIVGALGAIEYAVVTTLASGSYREMPIFVSYRIYTLSLFIMMIIVGILFIAGILSYTISRLSITDIEHKVSDFIVRLCTGYFITSIILYVIFIIRINVKPEYADISWPELANTNSEALVTILISAAIIAGHSVKRSWAYIFVTVVVSLSVISFYTGLYRDTKKFSYYSDFRYCSAIAATRDDIDTKSTTSPCYMFNSKDNFLEHVIR